MSREIGGPRRDRADEAAAPQRPRWLGSPPLKRPKNDRNDLFDIGQADVQGGMTWTTIPLASAIPCRFPVCNRVTVMGYCGEHSRYRQTNGPRCVW